MRKSDSVPLLPTRTALSRPRRTKPTVVSTTSASWTTLPAGKCATRPSRATSWRVSSDAPWKYSCTFRSGMTSSLMAAPLEFAADMIAESHCRGFVRDIVHVGELTEFLERQGPVQSTVPIEDPIQAGVGDDTP